MLVLLLLAFAGITSLATEQGPPVVDHESGDSLTFSGDQRTEVRHVRIEIHTADSSAGDSSAQLSADVSVDTGPVHGVLPVVLSVVRDRDGASFPNQMAAWLDVGDTDNPAGFFDAIESCPSGQTCSETFTFTFDRILYDPRPSLTFDWSVHVEAEYPELTVGATPPPGASLLITITP